MLSALIGVFDFPSMLVVAAICGGLSMPFIVYIVRKPTDLEKAKLQMDRDVAMANVERVRQTDIKKIEQNLITSHRSSDE